MKKLIGLFTVALMLIASSAFAVTAEFPAYYNGSIGGAAATFGSGTGNNGTQLFFTGMGLNATTKNVGKTLGTVMFLDSNLGTGAKTDAFYVNATYANAAAGGVFNGTISFTNGSDTRERDFGNQSIPTAVTAAHLTFDQDLAAVSALTTLPAATAVLNATNYFVPAGNYQMMVGIANATFNATAITGNAYKYEYAGRRGLGVSMPVVYQNGTFKNSASSTWSYYAYGTRKANPVVVYGQVTINTLTGNDNAAVSYFIQNSTGTTNKADQTYTYNATGLGKLTDGGYLHLANTKSGFINLIENGTINKSENMITGYVNTADQRLFAVMVKDATVISTSDVQNRAFNLVFAGSGVAGQEMGNATAGIMQFNADTNLGLRGESQVWTPELIAAKSTMKRTNTSLTNFSAAIASTSQFQVSQSNMTIYGTDGSTVVGYFYGKQSADKVFSVGIYESVATDAAYRSLAFLIPTAATTAAITNSGYQANATMTDGTVATQLDHNSTGYTQVALRTQWTGLPSDFTPLTDVKGYGVTSAGAMGDTSWYYTASFQMTGVGGDIEKLRLYKVMTDGSTVSNLTYAQSAETTTDGVWWISKNLGDTYMGKDSILDPSVEYYVNWVVKDNGSYDTNNTLVNGIVDPVILGSVPSSSSSSGCVFNPAAGFGLEWLLLMLAPMVAIVRSRFK